MAMKHLVIMLCLLVVSLSPLPLPVIALAAAGATVDAVFFAVRAIHLARLAPPTPSRR